MKVIRNILIIILFVSCFDTHKINTDVFVYKTRTPMGVDKHELIINYDSSFSYNYITNMFGKTNGKINGTWHKYKDSLYLKIHFPIDYKLKKSFVDYLNFGSQDSIYIMIFNLYPEILSINLNIYNSVSLSTIETCKTDTCSSFDCFDSKCLLKSFCHDKIVVPKHLYDSFQKDTLLFFDPNDFLLDKSLPIKIDSFNCIKVYHARKVKYDFLDIPTRYKYKGNRLHFFDSSNRKGYFKMTKKPAHSLSR